MSFLKKNLTHTVKPLFKFVDFAVLQGRFKDSVELLNPEQFATAKKHGLTCAIANNGMAEPPFMKGLNNPRYQQTVIDTTKKTIDACAADDIPSTIAFTGYKWNDAEDPSSGEISRLLPDARLAASGSR